MITTPCRKDRHDECDGELDPRHKKGRWCGCDCHSDDRQEQEAREVGEQAERLEGADYASDFDVEWEDE